MKSFRQIMLAICVILIASAFAGCGAAEQRPALERIDFFPLLRAEVRQTREAMCTRGAGGLLNPAILYRAFLIPLMVRLVNLSDTLALSVETRGFTTYPAPYTVYRPVYLQARDGAFAALSALCAMGAVLL